MASTIANVREQAGGYAAQAGGYAAQLVGRARERWTGGGYQSPAENEGGTERANETISEGAATISEGAAATISASATLGGAVLVAPAVAGFTAEGVAAGSMAAAWQGTIGNVAAGSTFAQLQSFGAIYTAAPALGAGLVVAGVGGAGYLGWRRYKSWNAPHPPPEPPFPPGTQDPELLSDTELRKAIVGLGGQPQGCADREALVALYLLLVERQGGGQTVKEEHV